MNLIEIGKIVAAVGLKGQIKIYHYTDYKERFEELETIIIDNNTYHISGIRYSKEQVVLNLEGICDRNGAEALIGKKVYISEKDLRELPEDTYYVKDLIGCKVFDEAKGFIGKINYVIQNSSQDIYEVETESKKFILIPAVGEFIKEVDIENRTVRVSLIEGFTDEN